VGQQSDEAAASLKTEASLEPPPEEPEYRHEEAILPPPPAEDDPYLEIGGKPPTMPLIEDPPGLIQGIKCRSC
jgi:hypothetical protein